MSHKITDLYNQKKIITFLNFCILANFHRYFEKFNYIATHVKIHMRLFKLMAEMTLIWLGYPKNTVVFLYPNQTLSLHKSFLSYPNPNGYLPKLSYP